MKWTFEKIQESALSFTTRNSFKFGNNKAYEAARRTGTLDAVCRHMEESKTKKWTNEDLALEALKYKSRVDFETYSSGAYQVANKRGILDNICRHMLLLVRRPYSFEELRIEALKFKTRKEFQDNSKSIYVVSLKRGLLDQICAHMGDPLRYPWTNSELAEEAKLFSTRGEFQEKSSGAYQVARNRGLLDKICSHMPNRIDQSGKNSHLYKWTFESIKAEAIKSNTRAEFRANSPKAYSVANNRGIMDIICSHMKVLWEEKWDEKTIREESIKYGNRTDFQKNAGGAFGAARRLRIIEEVCSHMKYRGGISTMERELFDTIKLSFSTTKRLRVVGINVLNKPYIYGFDIDIFVPELSKGIEFDGTYYHSFKYMRNDPRKSKWSDEDIFNYHEIKDDYFATSRGIEILHIKEADWIANKQACINRCLEFLGG